MNEVFNWKKNVSLSRYLDFCVFDESTSLTLLHIGSFKMTFGQKLVKLMKNVSNLFLASLRRSETISRPLHDFDKIAI